LRTITSLRGDEDGRERQRLAPAGSPGYAERVKRWILHVGHWPVDDLPCRRNDPIGRLAK
jgi:hypothetical protein